MLKKKIDDVVGAAFDNTMRHSKKMFDFVKAIELLATDILDQGKAIKSLMSAVESHNAALKEITMFLTRVASTSRHSDVEVLPSLDKKHDDKPN